MKVGDLIIITRECYDITCTGDFGIITYIRNLGDVKAGTDWIDIEILFSDGLCMMEPDDIEVINELD
jgi:hypothetical protein